MLAIDLLFGLQIQAKTRNRFVVFREGKKVQLSKWTYYAVAGHDEFWRQYGL